jgi:hypothetical protein
MPELVTWHEGEPFPGAIGRTTGAGVHPDRAQLPLAAARLQHVHGRQVALTRPRPPKTGDALGPARMRQEERNHPGRVMSLAVLTMTVMITRRH